ncbi:MAG: hypothetical protein ACI8RE_000805 [Ilumatobacter sp.]
MAISALALVPSSVIAHHGSDAAKQAAADIQAAQDRANDASQAMFDAESDIDGLGIDIAATDMQDGLEAQAVRSFVGAGSGGDFDLFIDFDDSNDSNDSNDSLTADVMSAMTRETAHDDLPETVKAEIETLAEIEAERLGNEEFEHGLQRQRERRAAEEAVLAARQAGEEAAQQPSANASGQRTESVCRRVGRPSVGRSLP